MSRENIRIELRELYEQDRRQCSVILGGFNAVNQDDVKRKFVDMCVATCWFNRIEWIEIARLVCSERR